MRATAADYDGWRNLGNEGWGWADVLAYFKRSEAHFLGETKLHGGSGELAVSPLHEPHRASKAFVDAAATAGVARNDDFNGPTQEGVGYLQLMFAMACERRPRQPSCGRFDIARTWWFR